MSFGDTLNSLAILKITEIVLLISLKLSSVHCFFFMCDKISDAEKAIMQVNKHSLINEPR